MEGLEVEKVLRFHEVVNCVKAYLSVPGHYVLNLYDQV